MDDFRTEDDPCPLNDYANWNRESPDEGKALKKIKDDWKHQVQLDADKYKVKMEKSVTSEEGYQEIRQCFRCDERHTDFRVQVAADAEVENRKDKIRDEYVEHALLIEFLEKLHCHFTVIIRIEQDEAA